MWWPLFVALVQQDRMVTVDVPAHAVLSDSSGAEPGGRRAEFFGFRCTAGLGLQIDAISTWDNIALILGEGGRIVARDDDAGSSNNARIAWTCPDNNLYRIGVASYHYGVGGPFDLRLTATNDVGKPAGPPMLRFDTLVRAVLSTSAPRYLNHPMATYTFRCGPDVIVRISMISQFDNMLFLFGPAGQVDASDDARGTNALILYRCHDAEVYRIGAAAREGGDSGPYRLYLRNVRAGNRP